MMYSKHELCILPLFLFLEEALRFTVISKFALLEEALRFTVISKFALETQI